MNGDAPATDHYYEALDDGVESRATEDDPDWDNDPDFQGNINGQSVEPSQYTQSGMDHDDPNRGDIDFDDLGESKVKGKKKGTDPIW